MAGLLSLSPVLTGQTAERVEVAESSETFLQLKLPKARATAFFRIWTQANIDLENGRTVEARRGFASVLAMLDELESMPSQRERVVLAKANLHARVLGDKVAARRELARVLALNPKSTEALVLENSLKAEERKPLSTSETSTGPVELLPRLDQRKEGKP